MRRSRNLRIAIIGAGAAGLAAAQRLKDIGYRPRGPVPPEDVRRAMIRMALEETLRSVKTPRNCSLSGAVLLVTILLFGSSPLAPMAEARGLSSRSYSVGGTVSGLAGGDLVLVNAETEALSVSSDGPFTFTLTSPGGAEYSVLLATQPPGQVCTVANGSGVVANVDITGVTVACTTATPPRAGRAVVDHGPTSGPAGSRVQRAHAH